MLKRLLSKIGLGDCEKEVKIGISIFLGIVMLFQFWVGILDANDDKECRLKSVFDVVVSPAYAAGCAINKNRFDIKIK